jgi:hypothetical protein
MVLACTRLFSEQRRYKRLTVIQALMAGAMPPAWARSDRPREHESGRWPGLEANYRRETLVPLRPAGLPHPLARRGFTMTARARPLGRDRFPIVGPLRSQDAAWEAPLCAAPKKESALAGLRRIEPKAEEAEIRRSEGILYVTMLRAGQPSWHIAGERPVRVEIPR